MTKSEVDLIKAAAGTSDEVTIRTLMRNLHSRPNFTYSHPLVDDIKNTGFRIAVAKILYDHMMANGSPEVALVMAGREENNLDREKVVDAFVALAGHKLRRYLHGEVISLMKNYGITDQEVSDSRKRYKLGSKAARNYIELSLFLDVSKTIRN
jgi:hypothetical protein